jgi:hypothetical protein
MMKRLILFTAFVLLWASTAWGTDRVRYVSSLGDNSDGTTWAKAYTSNNAALTYLNTQAITNGHTLYVAGGVSYLDDYVYANNANHAKITIIGTTGHGSTTPATGSQRARIAILAGKFGLYAAQGLQTISGLRFTGGTLAGLSLNGASNLLLSDVDMQDGVSTAELMKVQGTTSGWIIRCKVQGSAYNTPVDFTGSGTVNILDSIFANSAANLLGLSGSDTPGIRNNGTGTINLFQSIVTGAPAYALKTTNAAAVINAYNSILKGGNRRDAGAGTAPLRATAGLIHVENCHLIPSFMTQAFAYSNYTFTITAATVTIGDVYTNGTDTYLVTASSTGTTLNTVGTGAPAANGTLTWSSGSSTSAGTITFSSVTAAGTIEYKNLNNNMTSVNPKIRRRSRFGIIMPSVGNITSDGLADGLSINYVRSIAAKLRAYGWRMDYMLDTAMIPTYLSQLNSLKADYPEVEFSGHTYSHSNLISTNPIYTATKAGTTIDVQRGNNKIVVAGAVSGEITDFKTKTVSAIRTELLAILGVGTVTAVHHDFNYYWNTVPDSNMLGEALTGTDTPQSAAGGYAFLTWHDTTLSGGIYKAELLRSFQDIQSYFGTTPIGLTFPGGAESIESRTAALTAGYRITRGALTSESSCSWHLFPTVDLGGLGNATTLFAVTDNETVTKFKARVLCEHFAQHGGICGINAHNAGELTLNQWDWILSVFAEYPEIRVCNSTQAVGIIDALVASGAWTTSDNRNYTVGAAGMDQSDYHLTGGSSCIMAGKDITASVANMTDLDGHVVISGSALVGLWSDGVDIGPYAFEGGRALLGG